MQESSLLLWAAHKSLLLGQGDNLARECTTAAAETYLLQLTLLGKKTTHNYKGTIQKLR